MPDHVRGKQTPKAKIYSIKDASPKGTQEKPSNDEKKKEE
jgi:hypothetical protein